LAGYPIAAIGKTSVEARRSAICRPAWLSLAANNGTSTTLDLDQDVVEGVAQPESTRKMSPLQRQKIASESGDQGGIDHEPEQYHRGSRRRGTNRILASARFVDIADM
jgi:hypothetical protein